MSDSCAVLRLVKNTTLIKQRKPSPCPNKRAFYNWLAKEAQDAFNKHWAEQKHSEESGISDICNIESKNIDEFSYAYSGIRIDSYTGLAEQVIIPAQIENLPVTS